MYSTYERDKLQFDAGIVYSWRQEAALACIVFTHGLGGDVDKTWGNLPMLVMGTAFARNKDIIVYSYKSSAFQLCSKSIELLTEEYVTFIESLANRYRKIYFITHSLGSVLTLSGLTYLFRRSDIWKRKVRGHILLAPALWGSYLGWISPSKTSRELKYKSKELEVIRSAWASSIKNAQCRSVVLFGSEDKVIEQNSNDLIAMNIRSKSVAKTHVSIPKTNSIDEITFRSIIDCLYEITGSSPFDSRSYIKSIIYDSAKSEWEYDDHLAEFTFLSDHKLKILQFDSRGEPDSFDEPWVRKFPDNNAKRIYFAAYYDHQRIFDFPMIFCDGFRYAIPMPRSRSDLIITAEQYQLARIMERSGAYEDIDSGLAIAGIRIE